MLHLTLRQLQIFAAVARCGSFSKASKELHLTQPAVSMQVKQLEESLGLPLLEQLKKRINLTDAGRELQHTSVQIMQQLVSLEHNLDALQGLQRGSLTVGVVSTASSFAIRLISQFRGLHPDIRITLNVVNREALLQHIAENTVDLALMGQPPAHLELEQQVFMENPLVVIAPIQHPLAKAKKIPLTEIAHEPFVGREPGSGTRMATEAFFQAHGLSWQVAMEMNKNEAIKLAVEAGLGLGVVSRHTVTLELAAKRICTLDVEGFPIRRSWYLVNRKTRTLSLAARAFAEFVVTESPRLGRML